MPWLFLLLAIGAFAIAMTTKSMALSVICILLALALLAIWLMGLISQRVGNQSRSDAMMIDPVDLKRMRELAEARQTAQTGRQPGPSDPPASGP